MNPSKSVKLLVGVLSVWPLIYMFLFLGFVAVLFVRISSAGSHGPEPSAGMPIAFMALFLAHLSTILLMFGLLVFYIVYLFKSDRVAQDKKALWAVVLFLGNALAMPVFFCIYVWPDKWPLPESGLKP